MCRTSQFSARLALSRWGVYDPGCVVPIKVSVPIFLSLWIWTSAFEVHRITEWLRLKGSWEIRATFLRGYLSLTVLKHGVGLCMSSAQLPGQFLPVVCPTCTLKEAEDEISWGGVLIIMTSQSASWFFTLGQQHCIGAYFWSSRLSGKAAMKRRSNVLSLLICCAMCCLSKLWKPENL